MSSVMQELAPVSIVVAGSDTLAGKAMLELAAARPDKFHPPIDVRRWLLVDPSQNRHFRIPHDRNSEFLPCQLSLLRGANFFECVRDIATMIGTAVGARKVWVLYCTLGQHHSDGVAKAICTRVLNNMSDADRYYNCNIFSLSCADRVSLDHPIVWEALQWAQTPWLVRNEDVLWGTDATYASSVANFVLAKVDSLQHEIHGLHVDKLEVIVRPREGAQEEVRPTIGAAEVEAVIARAEATAAESQPRDVKRAHPRQQCEGRASSSADGGQASKRAKVGVPRSPPIDAPCPYCGGSGRDADVDHTLEDVDTVEAWSVVLRERGVDDGARLDWCSLYSANLDGKQRALAIVHKLLRKESGHYAVNKPSAFVVSGCRKEWHAVRDALRVSGGR